MQTYAQSLEVSLASLRSKLRDQNAEVASLKNELARTKYQKTEDDRDVDKDQKYHHMVEEATRVLELLFTVFCVAGCSILNLFSHTDSKGTAQDITRQ